MKLFKSPFSIVSVAVFLVTMTVYFFTAERTGSLWDCGEFILGAYKLQVVHPPGAPLFLIVGRLFAWVGDLLSSNPSDIAFAVNLLSALCTAAGAALVAHLTMLLSKIVMDQNYPDSDNTWLCAGAGLVAGLASGFCASIWFSAVEGEVYAMSTFFTILTVWAVVKWYTLPNENTHDRWLVFSAYSAGLSVGVHLLSLLAFPALALLVYFKKKSTHTYKGAFVAMIAGGAIIPIVQKFIIAGIPALWNSLEIFSVNSLGLPFDFGVIPTLLIVAGVFYAGFRYAANKNSHLVSLLTMGALMITLGFSTVGVVVIRAKADTPVNMNVPSDATRLLPYLNREQYGERALLFGPHYAASPIGYDKSDRRGKVDFPPYTNAEIQDKEYQVVEEKISAKYKSSDKILFPRIGHSELGRAALHERWYQQIFGGTPTPSFAYNIAFYLKYQVNWMYFRYFMWNFAGRQNGTQGFAPWDKSAGHWESGIKPIDEMRLYNMDQLPKTMREHKARNHFYMIPMILGLLGLVFHLRNSPKEFSALFALFLITGIGIMTYTNPPPNEPRERDYVLAGSMFTYSIWIGLAALALFTMIRERAKLAFMPSTALAVGLALTAPILMGSGNFDDMGRRHHYASRDYAKNFLNSLQPNAILFTYGDNDTYPLWYAQEVENVRRDVRIVNLSLIAVDWYINKLRRKLNDSEPIKLTIPAAAYRGSKRNQVPFYNGGREERPLDLSSVLRFIGSDNQLSASGGTMTFESYIPTHQMFIPVNIDAVNRLGLIRSGDSVVIENQIQLNFSPDKAWLTKDDLAVMDVIGSNIWERPIYFATTCRNEKLLGLNDYMQMEGLALRIVPFKSTSDPTFQIYGSGKVATDLAYDNIMNKWAWGNFDKKQLYVDNSYGAAIQAHRMVMMRTANELLLKGEVQKAVDIADKFFEGFPHMNFQYDAGITSFLNIYLQTGQREKLIKHAGILAEETRDFLNFYESINPDVLQSSFMQDYRYRMQAAQSLFGIASMLKDDGFSAMVEEKLSKYRSGQMLN